MLNIAPVDDDGNYIQVHTIVASGDAALVVHRQDMAIKMAIVYRHYTLEQAEENRSIIRREQEVWRRIQPDFNTPVQGIIQCLGLRGDTIEMRYMPGGTLLKWLQHRARPSIQLQKRWFRQLAIGLHNLHQHRVIHSDILSRNILMDGSLNVAICDLGASSLMPICHGGRGGCLQLLHMDRSLPIGPRVLRYCDWENHRHQSI